MNCWPNIVGLPVALLGSPDGTVLHEVWMRLLARVHLGARSEVSLVRPDTQVVGVDVGAVSA